MSHIKFDWKQWAKTAYPRDYNDDYFSAPCDYTPIIELAGEVLVRVDEAGYQGDTFALIKKGRRYAYLRFGWGSCSGCDSLQACDSYQDIADLAKMMVEPLQWRTKKETIDWFKKHDWKGDWCVHKPEFKEFISAVFAHFNTECPIDLDKLSEDY